MSYVRKMIDAARDGNAVEFEKNFMEDASSRLGNALGALRADVYRSALGLSEEEEECEDNKKKMSKTDDVDHDEDENLDNEED